MKMKSFEIASSR